MTEVWSVTRGNKSCFLINISFHCLLSTDKALSAASWCLYTKSLCPYLFFFDYWFILTLTSESVLSVSSPGTTDVFERCELCKIICPYWLCSFLFCFSEWWGFVCDFTHNCGCNPLYRGFWRSVFIWVHQSQLWGSVNISYIISSDNSCGIPAPP